MAFDNFFLYSLVVAALIIVIIIVLLIRPRKSVNSDVEKMVKSGKSLDEVLDYARQHKWNEREAKLYFLVYNVKDFLNRGHGIDEVASMAEDSGWPKEMVDIVISKLNK